MPNEARASKRDLGKGQDGGGKIFRNGYAAKKGNKSIVQLILYAYRTVFCDIEHALFDIRYPRPSIDVTLMDMEYEGTGAGKHIHKIMGDVRAKYADVLLSQAREFRRIVEAENVNLVASKMNPERLTCLLDKRTELFGILVPAGTEMVTSEDAFLRSYLLFLSKYREWLAGCAVDYAMFQKYVFKRILADVLGFPEVMEPVCVIGTKEKPILEEIFEEVIEASKQRRPVDLVAAGLLTEEEADAPRVESSDPPTTADIIFTAYALTHWLVKFMIVIRQLQEGMLVFVLRHILGDSSLQVPRRKGDTSLCLKLLLLTGITVNVDVTSLLRACRQDFSDFSYKVLYAMLSVETVDIVFVRFLEEAQNVVEDGLGFFQRFSELRPLLITESRRGRKKVKCFPCLGKRKRQKTDLGKHEFKTALKLVPAPPKGFYAVSRYSVEKLSPVGVGDAGYRQVLVLEKPCEKNGDSDDLEVKITASEQSSFDDQLLRDEHLKGKSRRKKCCIM